MNRTILALLILSLFVVPVLAQDAHDRGVEDGELIDSAPTSTVWLYSLASVALVSLVAFIGVFTLALTETKLQQVLIYMVSFAAGGLFGDVFIHLLPESVASTGFTLHVSFYVLGGIVTFFILEKVVRWHHHHTPHREEHPKSFATMSLVGDAVHNFVDGLIIGVSYLVSISVGVATTVAVIFHEIPQEIADFGILLHGGYHKKKAVMFNFLTALTAVIGAVVALVAAKWFANLTSVLIPFAAGGFVYVAGSDLIPELHNREGMGKSLLQLLAFLLGIAVMAALTLLE